TGTAAGGQGEAGRPQGQRASARQAARGVRRRGRGAGVGPRGGATTDAEGARLMGSGVQRVRCGWATTELGIAYHDAEWGVPQHDDRVLFEFLILEGAQAGLSWETILRKRDAYRAAFDQFDPAKVAKYDAKRQAKLMANEGIVRNKLKITSAVTNA